jgi:hypothetical protein
MTSLPPALQADHDEYVRKSREYLDRCAKDDTLGCIQRVFGGCFCKRNACELKREQVRRS